MKVLLFFVLLIYVYMLGKILKVMLEKYNSDPNAYNYDRENPNALVSGRAVAGTVYSSNVGNTPGLGWIL